MAGRKTKRCGVCGSIKKRPYCLNCKAQRERNRYARNAENERARKRIEYAEKHGHPIRPYTRSTAIYGELMDATTCEHLLAEQIPKEQIANELPGVPEDAIVFACFDCGNFLNEAGEVITAPEGGSNAGKASAPQVTGQNQNAHDASAEKRSYHRDPSIKVTVKCKQTGCKNKWQVWPQNAEQAEYCPQLHKALVRKAQQRARAVRFRQRHK